MWNRGWGFSFEVPSAGEGAGGRWGVCEGIVPTLEGSDEDVDSYEDSKMRVYKSERGT